MQRRRTEGKKGVRYEFVSARAIGVGATCSVYRVQGTLAITKNSIHFKPYGYKARVVKKQQHNKEYPLSKVINEYNLSKKAANLAIKPPTIVGSTSYLFMKKLPGRELYEIISDDFDGRVVLSLEQRIGLTDALLNALKEQVTDKGLIHRDIKADNIFADLCTNPISVNIFDFGLSVLIGKSDGKSPGSPAYAPPEIFYRGKQTPKVDVYSLARVIALLWRVDLASYSYTNDYQYVLSAENVNLDTLFMGITDLSDNNKQIIQSTLQSMLEADSDMRMSIEEAIERFSQVTIAFPSKSNPNAQRIAAIYPESKKRLKKIFVQLELLKAQADNLDGRQECRVAEKVRSLASRLEGNLKALDKMTPHDYQLNVLLCIQNCQNLIKDNKEEFKKHRNSNYIIANIALGIAGLGFIYLTAGLINLATTGNFLFFNETKTSELFAKVEENFTCLEKGL